MLEVASYLGVIRNRVTPKAMAAPRIRQSKICQACPHNR